MHIIEVKPGEEVIEKVTTELAKKNIINGAIVSLLGAVDSCCISNMPKDDATADILNEYSEPFEMSGSGDVKNGKPHIHCVMSRENEIALAGHLHWARVDTWFVRLYIISTP
jgi:predicted DNA-binding protein with PD1-like motif